MTSALALLASVVVVTATPAKVNGSPPSKLQIGQAEFNRGDFLGALRTLESAIPETSDERTLAKIHLLRGQCYAARQDFAAAEQAFALALENDPEVSLDPAKVDPTLVRMLDGLRNRLRGELRVRADRAGAQVALDGKVLGPVPLRSSVPIGRHTVEAKTADGSYATSREVVVRLKRPTEVALQLQPVRSSARSESASSPSREEVVLPFADLRAPLDPFASRPLGFEVGGGIEYLHWRAAAGAILYPEFGLALRGALSVPLEDRFNGYVSLEIPIIFAGTTAFALGGAGGVEYEVNRWFVPFLEVGVRHFFTGAGDADPNRFVLQMGIRLKVP